MRTIQIQAYTAIHTGSETWADEKLLALIQELKDTYSYHTHPNTDIQTLLLFSPKMLFEDWVCALHFQALTIALADDPVQATMTFLQVRRSAARIVGMAHHYLRVIDANMRHTSQMPQYRQEIENVEKWVEENKPPPSLYPLRRHFSTGYLESLYQGTLQFDRALALVNETLQHHPDNASALYRRGLIHLDKGKRRSARADFTRALTLAENNKFDTKVAQSACQALENLQAKRW